MTVSVLWRMIISTRHYVYNAAINEPGFGAPACDKDLRVGRILADLEAADVIAVPHVAETIRYWSLDRMSFRWGSKGG